MDDILNQETLANVPPPPAEVKVRTMRSDVEAIQKNGGGSPQFRTVSVQGTSLAKTQIGGGAAQPASRSSATAWGIVVLALAVLAVVAWFAYVTFFAKK